MEMTFKDALEHAMRITGRGKSVRDVAIQAGISYDILKNIRQSKSAKPNAEAATKVADFFGVSLKDFYAGRVHPFADEDAEARAADAAKITELVSRLSDKKHRDQVEAFAKALLQTEQAKQQIE